MKTTAASILIMFGCFGVMPDTHAKPSPTPKPARGDGGKVTLTSSTSTSANGGGGKVTLSAGRDLTSGSGGSPGAATPSPHLHIGRNYGRVQQSSQSGQAPGGHYIGLDHTLVNKPNPQQATAHHASGSYSARVGSTTAAKGKQAGGNKTKGKVSPTPRPR